MTTTPTQDTAKTVDQTLRLVDAGCEIVRITAPTPVDAKNLENIKSELLRRGCDVPLVADIHFRPDAAMVAADFVEKVRINPGNFVDGKAFKTREYTDEEYAAELRRIEDKFTPLVQKLKTLRRALRIGTNHGSLSDRIMNRFGDTPLGMVESALEYLRICRRNDFHDIILSMKASNPRVMIAAYRLLSVRMAEEGMDYPFHLGVTEAGDGEDGRIKSAAGIGSLLEDGIGDTIRVSLTEDPEYEIPVAQALARRYAPARTAGWSVAGAGEYVTSTFELSRRPSSAAWGGPVEVGGASPIRVAAHLSLGAEALSSVMSVLETQVKKDTPPEILEVPFTGKGFASEFGDFRARLARETGRVALWVSFKAGEVPSRAEWTMDGVIYDFEKIDNAELVRVAGLGNDHCPIVLRSSSPDTIWQAREILSPLLKGSVILGVRNPESVHAVRALAARLRAAGDASPIWLESFEDNPTVETAAVLGSLICDGLGDIVSVARAPLSNAGITFAYNLLQACGNRITKTEYVSCPSCGRTLFDLQTTTERIKAKTGHLKGVKIAIMGCIVNGPGEMADADFGYVGGGPGKINLYVGKTCVEKSIPMAEADQRLIDLIKTHGRWVDPA